LVGQLVSLVMQGTGHVAGKMGRQGSGQTAGQMVRQWLTVCGEDSEQGRGWKGHAKGGEGGV
jgi:hypothetical protein